MWSRWTRTTLACCAVRLGCTALWLAVVVGSLPAQAHEKARTHERKAEPLPVTSNIVLRPGEPVVLGMSVPLTGPTSHLGQEMVRGVYSYIRRVNKAGGVHGRQLKLVILDDGYEPAQTIANTRRLLEHEKAFAFLGFVGTPAAQVAVPVAQRAGVPFVAPLTGAAFLHDVPTYSQGVVFNIRPSYSDETRAMVDYLLKKQKVKRIGLLVQDDAYGNDGRTSVQEALAKYGLDVAVVAKYQRNTSDIAPAVNKLRQAAPEAVIVIGTSAPTAAFVRKARAQGFRPHVLAVSSARGDALAAKLGSDGNGLVVTQVMPSPHDTENPLVKAYVRDAPKFDPKPTYVTLEGYLAAAVMVKMLQEAGPQLSRAALIKAAENMGRIELFGQSLSFSATNHSGTDKVYFTRFTDGKIVPLAP